MYQTIKTLEDYNSLLESEPALLIYYSTIECHVCKVLKPKIREMIQQSFPKIKLVYVNLNESPELAAQNSIFVVPTIQLILDGHEYIRKSRGFSLNELQDQLARPYQLMFS
ncbi:thioredoxin family protein [Sunxiuqinia sp. sy24]|uniref:thioredoxin family protein n=1 Tax=Sunxiuqinia sp. sy24 TaxID=3461495 RepID=UPI0040462954